MSDKMFEIVADVFARSAHGMDICQLSEFDYNEVLKESILYGVGTVVYSGLKKNNVSISSELNADFMQFLYRNTQKKIKIYNVLNTLKNNNIDFLILKGASLSKLYFDIHSRVSADTDIYIKNKEADKICHIMSDVGFEILPRWEGSHHIKCVSSSCGMIELHTQFFDKLVSELWFDNEECMEVTKRDFVYDGYKFSTLAYSEGLLFIFLHFVKHFITGDFSLMQLMDNLLYLKNYNGLIDYGKIIAVLDKLGYYKFFKICIGFGIRYLHFSEDDFNIQVENSIELSSILKTEFINRAHGLCENLYDQYGEKIYIHKKTNGSYKKLKNKTNTSYKGYFVINKSAFYDKYPILNNYRCLFVFCYIHRAVKGILKKIFKSRKENRRGRMQVIEQLGF